VIGAQAQQNAFFLASGEFADYILSLRMVLPAELRGLLHMFGAAGMIA